MMRLFKVRAREVEEGFDLISTKIITNLWRNGLEPKAKLPRTNAKSSKGVNAGSCKPLNAVPFRLWVPSQQFGLPGVFRGTIRTALALRPVPAKAKANIVSCFFIKNSKD